MGRERRNFIILLAAIAIVIAGGWAAVYSLSGVNPPFTVVESHSMQHCQYDDRHSEIGVIDTGDLVYVKSKEKVGIRTYVEGSQDGFSTFGDYGSVIVYYRENYQKPVIHRAFVWLDCNGDGTWSAPSLKNYQGEWECESGEDWSRLSGTISFQNVGNVAKGGKTLSIDLDDLRPSSGFLTVGDSVSNGYFDQSSSISLGRLVSYENIKSVAYMELPWIGSVKLLLNDNREITEWAENSITMLICLTILMITVITSLGYAIDEIKSELKRRKEE